MTDKCATRPWRSGDLDILRASESIFAPPACPRSFPAGGRPRPLHLRVADQLAVPKRRWTGQVALEAGRLIALAECSWEVADPDSATLTVNVAHDQQAGGIGRRALRDLVSRCLSMGLTTFTMDYAASNVTPSAMRQAIGAGAGARHLLRPAEPDGRGCVISIGWRDSAAPPESAIHRRHSAVAEGA